MNLKWKGVRFTAVMGLLSMGVLVSSPMVSYAEQTAPFNDIQVGSPYFVQVNFLRENGIVKGYDDNTFRPDQAINRAEAAILLKKALIDFGNKKNTPSEKKTFTMELTDVPKTHWAYEAIKELAQKSIINRKAKTFRPSDTINLAEAVKMTIKAEQIYDPSLTIPSDAKSPFKDMKGTEWFAPYIELANTKTMLVYSTKMNIHPDEKMTRGSFVDLMYRAIKTREPGHFFGRGTFYSDFFQGRGTSNGEKYDMNAYTAANKELPFDTKLKVTYLRNNQSVVVRVNDRGPFTPSLNLDMSRKAFTDLADPSEGIIPIEYQITKEDPLSSNISKYESPVSSEALPKNNL